MIDLFVLCRVCMSLSKGIPQSRAFFFLIEDTIWGYKSPILRHIAIILWVTYSCDLPIIPLHLCWININHFGWWSHHFSWVKHQGHPIAHLPSPPRCVGASSPRGRVGGTPIAGWFIVENLLKMKDMDMKYFGYPWYPYYGTIMWWISLWTSYFLIISHIISYPYDKRTSDLGFGKSWFRIPEFSSKS